MNSAIESQDTDRDRRRGTTKIGGMKHALDKFYTKPEVALQCLRHLDLDSYDVVIEPSAGSGAFSSLIPGCISYDLEPEGENIIQGDWLILDKSSFMGKRALVVGNPPFGNNGSLAMKFIVESATFASAIAFILPRGFKKASVKERVPLSHHLTYEEELPRESFTLLGEGYGVPCVFQIWERGEKPRERNTPLRTSEYFAFTTKDRAQLRVQRVGRRAGRASLDLNASENSNYFLTAGEEYTPEELVDLFNALHHSSIDDTTGPRSLSKGELIAAFNAKLEEMKK